MHSDLICYQCLEILNHIDFLQEELANAKNKINTYFQNTLHVYANKIGENVNDAPNAIILVSVYTFLKQFKSKVKEYYKKIAAFHFCSLYFSVLVFFLNSTLEIQNDLFHFLCVCGGRI